MALLRQYFPKKMRLDGVTMAEVDAVVQELNHRPRKRLGWDAPELAWKRETNGPMQGELWYKPLHREGVVLGIKTYMAQPSPLKVGKGRLRCSFLARIIVVEYVLKH